MRDKVTGPFSFLFSRVHTCLLSQKIFTRKKIIINFSTAMMDATPAFIF
jgi:hypothetical protein